MKYYSLDNESLFVLINNVVSNSHVLNACGMLIAIMIYGAVSYQVHKQIFFSHLINVMDVFQYEKVNYNACIIYDEKLTKLVLNILCCLCMILIVSMYTYLNIGYMCACMYNQGHDGYLTRGRWCYL